MERNIDFIVEKYSEMIFRTAYAYLNNYAEAEDIVSDVLMKYFSCCEELSFNDGEHLKAWLIRVTVNRCKDVLKSSRFKINKPIDTEYKSEFNWSEAEIDVKNALEKLDEKYRIVIYLYYYEGYTNSDEFYN